jgi:TetR/AcrR family transcriptional regulator, transcriptional repressor of aconitase
MPQEHLDARRRQILDAARRCFIRNGFHTTSMQDVLAEAELSVGAVYRYFKSKDDIIAAIAAEALAEVAAAFVADDAEEPPGLDDIIDLVLAVEKPPLAGSPESARLLVQIWSEALRSPELAAQLGEVMAATRGVLGDLVAQHQKRGLLPDDVPAEQVAGVLIAFVDGFMVQRAVHGDADPAAFRNGLRALMQGTRPGR